MTYLSQVDPGDEALARRDLAALDAENARLRAALEQFCREQATWVYRADDSLACPFCHEPLDFLSERIVHTDECPVTEGRRVLGQR